MSDEQEVKPVLTKYQELLIDGIVGVGLPTVPFAEYATKQGFAAYSAKPTEPPTWRWIRERLEHCDEQELLSIYMQAKKVEKL